MFTFLRSSTGTDTSQADALFSEAYACIEQGLCYDEINDYDNTLSMYDRGLNLICEAEKAKNAKKSELYSHLLEAKNSVQARINVMKKEGPRQNPGVVNAAEPEKGDAGSSKANETKSDIRHDLDNVGVQEADLVYFLPEGVQLYTINGDDTTAPTYPTALEVYRFNPKDDTSSFAYEMEAPSAFIHVGPWVYPLYKGKTPVLRNDYGVYVVPNPTSEYPNMMVGIMLSVEEKLDAEFRQVLNEFAVLKEQEVTKELTPEENSRFSKKIADFLIQTGQNIAYGVQATSVKVASKVEDSGARYRAGVQPTDKPVTVNILVKGSVIVMHKGSKVVAKCTRYLLDKIGDVGVRIGKSVAAGAQNTFGDGKGGGVVAGTIAVIGGGIVGASTVWMALEDGSKVLCKSIANETVQNVKVKYGDEASDTTHHAFHAAGHGSLAAFQLWDLGPRSIAGRVAKRAGLQMVSDLHQGQGLPLPVKKAL